MSLAEISTERKEKFNKVSLDTRDEAFYERWAYTSIRAYQEEIVWTLERNEEIEQNPIEPEPTAAAPPTGCAEQFLMCCSVM